MFKKGWSLASAAAMLIMLLTLPAGALAQKAGTVKARPGTPGLGQFVEGISFRSIGPTRQGGRFVDFAVPLQQPNTFYAATGSGGLWKTVNNGQTFEPIFDNEKVFSIGDIAIAPSAPDILWVGTGEANNSRSTYWGNGLYKSEDGGKTWKHMGLEESHHIGRIIVHPEDPDVVYVAALGHLYSENPERGLYKTADGGLTWIKVLEVKAGGRDIGVVDAVMSPENPDVLYAAAYDRLRKPWTFQLGGPGSGIYKTTDGGKTWKKLAGGLPDGILGRIGLTVYPKNPDVLYAEIENANKPGLSQAERWQEIIEGKSSRGMIDGEIYRSDDAGETWTKVSPEKRSIGGSPGYYYGQIIVDPNDDKKVFVLSVGVIGSRDGGRTWVQPFRFGGDNHALWIDPKDSNHMLLGYDHGMGVTWDGGLNWHHPDFMPLAQFYAVDYDMSYPYRVAGGLQDNGSVLGPSNKWSSASGGGYGFDIGGAGIRPGPPIRLEDWSAMGGGDGMYNVFDRKTNGFLYNESQFGVIQRIDLASGLAVSIAYQRTKPETRWNWCSPIHVSHHDSNKIYHCGNIIVMSTNRGDIWREISPDLTTNDPSKLTVDGKGGDGNIQYCTITSFDESALVPGLLWAGTDDGNVWISRDDGGNWTKLNDRIKGNPGYWVSRVAASPRDPGTAYVSYTGYRRDDFRPYIYKTTDYGETWRSIAGDLAEGPVNVIQEDDENQNLLFAGTEFGVYVSIDGGSHWVKMENNMPTQPVHDLKIHPRDSDLIVATHGRGIFIADIKPLEELTEAVLASDVYLFEIESKPRCEFQDRRNASSSNYAGESEPSGIIINYYLKSKPEGEVKILVYKGNLLINEIRAANQTGLNRAVWNMTARRERTAEEKKAIQDRLERMREMGYSRMGGTDVGYAYFPVGEGEYTFELVVGEKKTVRQASVIPDLWKR